MTEIFQAIPVKLQGLRHIGQESADAYRCLTNLPLECVISDMRHNDEVVVLEATYSHHAEPRPLVSALPHPSRSSWILHLQLRIHTPSSSWRKHSTASLIVSKLGLL